MDHVKIELKLQCILLLNLLLRNNKILSFTKLCVKRGKQAGAELCQAQEKLGLAKGTLPEVVFHLI